MNTINFVAHYINRARRANACAVRAMRLVRRDAEFWSDHVVALREKRDESMRLARKYRAL